MALARLNEFALSFFHSAYQRGFLSTLNMLLSHSSSTKNRIRREYEANADISFKLPKEACELEQQKSTNAKVSSMMSVHGGSYTVNLLTTTVYI